jgi:hypothetical protein
VCLHVISTFKHSFVANQSQTYELGKVRLLRKQTLPSDVCIVCCRSFSAVFHSRLETLKFSTRGFLSA